jgi:hypothetical protein
MSLNNIKDYICFKFDENAHKYKVRVSLVKFHYENNNLEVYYSLKEKYKVNIEYFILNKVIQKGLYFEQSDLQKIYGLQANIKFIKTNNCCQNINLNEYIKDINCELGN